MPRGRKKPNKKRQHAAAASAPVGSSASPVTEDEGNGSVSTEEQNRIVLEGLRRMIDTLPREKCFRIFEDMMYETHLEKARVLNEPSKSKKDFVHNLHNMTSRERINLLKYQMDMASGEDRELYKVFMEQCSRQEREKAAALAAAALLPDPNEPECSGCTTESVEKTEPPVPISDDVTISTTSKHTPTTLNNIKVANARESFFNHLKEIYERNSQPEKKPTKIKMSKLLSGKFSNFKPISKEDPSSSKP